MKSSVRLVILALLLACGAALVAALYVSRVRSPLQSTLTSSFQLLGAPVKLVDRVASRMVPVSALDERELGDTYRRRFDSLGATNRFIRLGYDTDQIVFVILQQPSQNRQTDFARPDKDNAHRASELDALGRGAPAWTARRHRLRHCLFAGGHFTLADR